MVEHEARSILDKIAKVYAENAVFKLENTYANDDLELVKDLQIYAKNCDGCDRWVDIAYKTDKHQIFGNMFQVISIGPPFSYCHALDVILWCAERRDVGFFYRFGNMTKWTPLFKKGLTRNEMLVLLDLKANMS